LEGIPIVNVENACCSSTTALYGAWLEVASGHYDVALAVRYEKLFCGNTQKSQLATSSDSDMEVEGRMGFTFIGRYAMDMLAYMDKYGLTREQLAKVCVKNHKNGSLNPYAQYHKIFTAEEILNSRILCYPVTLYMMCPFGDGASATIVTTKEIARRHTSKPITIASLVLESGRTQDVRYPDRPNIYERITKEAYEQAGIGPEDLGAIELHDACTASEILHYDDFGLCEKGGAARLIEEGATEIGGRIPVNTSGGLESKGHPVGATGLGMLTEVVWQMRGECGARQIPEPPKVAMTQNGGGLVAGETAAQMITIVKR
jgi:acetyl-CoA acetyltransferase